MNLGRGLLKLFFRPFLWLMLIVLTGWAALAIYYSNLPIVAREAGSVVFAAAAIAVLVKLRPWRRAVTTRTTAAQ